MIYRRNYEIAQKCRSPNYSSLKNCFAEDLKASAHLINTSPHFFPPHTGMWPPILLTSSLFCPLFSPELIEPPLLQSQLNSNSQQAQFSNCAYRIALRQPLSTGLLSPNPPSIFLHFFPYFLSSCLNPEGKNLHPFHVGVCLTLHIPVPRCNGLSHFPKTQKLRGNLASVIGLDMSSEKKLFEMVLFESSHQPVRKPCLLVAPLSSSKCKSTDAHSDTQMDIST